MLSPSFLLIAFLIVTDCLAAASPVPVLANGQSMTLRKRASQHKAQRTTSWVKSQRESLKSKYGSPAIEKRATGINDIVNLNSDSTYFGSLAIGTPPSAFNVILDTGSSDLWLAGTQCKTCSHVPKFNALSSSTFTNLSSSFSIKYGSGAASGSLAADTVEMAGFEIQQQPFAVVDEVSEGLLQDEISGLLGLAWSTIAESGKTPFVQALAEQPNMFNQPLFSFFLTRFLDVETDSDNPQQFGGQVAFGFTNASFYDGAIDFVDIPAGQESFWLLPLLNVESRETRWRFQLLNNMPPLTLEQRSLEARRTSLRLFLLTFQIRNKERETSRASTCIHAPRRSNSL